MADKINTVPSKKPETETPTVVDSTGNPQTDAGEKKLDRIADRAANKAADTQKKFDQDHTTFSNI